MIKFGNKQVNKIMLGNKEVLKVIQGDGTSTGILKYQAGSTPTSPSYVAVIRYNASVSTNQATLTIYNNNTGIQIGQDRQGNYIMLMQTGRYEIRDLNSLQYYIRDIMSQAGVHQGEMPVLQDFQLDALNWSKTSGSGGRTCWLKIAQTDSPGTVYYNTQISNTTSALIGEVTNSDLTNAFSISNNSPVPSNASIKATTTQNGTTYNTRFTMNSITLIVFFDYA